MSWIDLLRAREMPNAASALPGRDEAMPVPTVHAVLGTPMRPPFPANCAKAIFGMGCFWGVERLFWQLDGIHTTAVGYASGLTPNPTYKEVCTGQTGHNEVVQVIYDTAVTDYESLLTAFWENHDPTQGMRQGTDRGTQYRSGIYYFTEAQQEAAETSLASFQECLSAAGFSEITTEILPAPTFYFAEEYHQQYLHKNPGGYCGMGGTGVSCAIGTGAPSLSAPWSD